MGQVPASTSFLILGDGRLASHLARYFELESIPYQNWNRRFHTEAELFNFYLNSTHILFAISDTAIQEFAHSHRYLLEKSCVHFSGAQIISEIPSAHPLMTFTKEMYDLNTYQSIPFITESGKKPLAETLPGLKNPSYSIEGHTKGLYHALCVMAGNFTTLLWEKSFLEFANLGLPKSVLIPYLEQTMKNLKFSDPGQTVLTGPLARSDRKTIEQNLSSLKDDPYFKVYKAFCQSYDESIADRNLSNVTQFGDPKSGGFDAINS